MMRPDVAADMERIFAPLGERPPASAARRTAGGRSRGSRDRRPRLPILAAPVLIAAVAAALAVGYESGDRSAPPTTAVARSARPAAVVTVPPRQPSVPAPSPVTVSPPAAAPAEARAAVRAVPRPVRDDADAGGRASPPRSSDPIARRPRAAVEASPSATANRPSRPGARPRPDAARTVAAVAAPRREGAADRSRFRRCEPGSLDDRCIYQDVLAADARLRLAYDRARRSGASPARLSTVVKRWKRAREDAQDDPDGTIRRYERLADALDEARLEGDR